MKELTDPSIARIGKKAGVKSMSRECHDTIRSLIEKQIDDIAATMLVVNSERQTKTIMADDAYDALALLGYNVTDSCSIGTKPVLHKSTPKGENQKAKE